MNLVPKSPVSITDVGAVIGFVLAVGVSVWLLKRAASIPVVGPVVAKLDS